MEDDMKRMIVTAVLVLGLFVCLQAAEEMTGQQVIEKFQTANLSAKGVVSKAEFVLKDLTTGSTEKRKIISISFSENGLKKMVFRFLDSTNKGTTFYSVEKPDKTKVSYIYLKSIGSARQVESSDKEKNFIDTDIANEDMGGSDIGDYVYTRIEDKKIGDRDCYAVEKVPVNKNSKYEKHLVYIDKATMVAIASKSWSRDGRVVKTIKQDDIREIAKGLYMAYITSVTDIERKHSTEINAIETTEKEVNRGYFNKNKLDVKWSEE
jgi:hypothetical protein